MFDSWIWTTLVVASQLAALIAVFLLLRKPRDPRAMLAWILALLFLPVLGLLLYVTVGEGRRGYHRVRRRRSRARLDRALRALSDKPLTPFTYRPQDARPGLQPVIRLTERMDAYPPTHGNQVTLYHDAERTYADILRAIDDARHHVHLEYYIYQPDATGRAFRDLLIRKAKEGVTCRLLLDYVGCWRLRSGFLRPMREAGVQIEFSLPMIPWRGRWRVNYRNHRKIVIVDGRCGFTGSQNIGDEYRGRLARLSPWRDTHLRVLGPAVHHLQETFIRDWHYTTRQALIEPGLFPAPEPVGNDVVQFVASGPNEAMAVMHQLLFAAVGNATRSISIITPYFVPDTAMILALQSAAYRGVQVRLIIPTRTDHRVVLWAGRSFYDELLMADIQIFEHDAITLHSKVMIVDDTWAMVGSANMDERSFTLNFEITGILYSRELSRELLADFDNLRSQSHLIRPRELKARPFGERIVLGMARLASPLL